jgi:uncharacterized RDD family membrane protein YckC
MSQHFQGHYAGFVSRLVAYVLDAVIISFVLTGMVWFINTMRSVLQNQSLIQIPVLSSTGTFVLAGTGATVVIALYFAFFWSVAGRTPGKAFMGLRVVTLDGGRLSFVRSLVRVFGYALSTAFFFIGFLWILVDNRRQGLHDKLARTYVVYAWEARYGGRHLTRVLEQGQRRAPSDGAHPEN